MAVGRVLGDIGRGTAILAAERQPLHHAAGDQKRRRQPPDLLIGRQASDQERREAHQPQRQHERVFAPDQIAQMPEEDRAERPHDEPGPEDAERIEEPVAHIAGEEMRGEKPREHAVQIEIVPLDQRAAGRRADDE